MLVAYVVRARFSYLSTAKCLRDAPGKIVASCVIQRYGSRLHWPVLACWEILRKADPGARYPLT